MGSEARRPLAGDTLRSAADLGQPMAGMTLLYRKGYFFQHLDAAGRQSEEPVAWPVDDFLQSTDAMCEVNVEGHPVQGTAVSRQTVRGDQP